MLPSPYRQPYEEFLQSLEQLLSTAQQPSLDGAALKQALQEVQQFFNGRILGVPVEELDPALASRVQSVHTEIHKQLRLLIADAMFFAASRQPATAQQRQSQVLERIQTLIAYAGALLKDGEEG
jgi:hypothetical protein